MNIQIKKPLLILAIASIIGCTHTPTMGEQMQTHSEDTKSLASKWLDGDKLLNKGQSLEKKGGSSISDGKSKIKKASALAKKGESQVKKGESQIEQSKMMIKEGNALKSDSEQEFKEKFPTKQP